MPDRASDENAIARDILSPAPCREEADDEDIRVVELTIAPVDDSSDASIPVLEEATMQSPVTESKRQLHLFVPALVAVTAAGMGVATFCTLVAGKGGVYLSSSVCELVGYGAVDIAVQLDDSSSQAGQPATAPPHLQNTTWVRGVCWCWLAIGLLKGTFSWLGSISFDMKDVGTWQLMPILCSMVDLLIRVVLVGGVMLRAHRDRMPNVMKWFVVTLCTNALAATGHFSPFPLVSALGNVLYLFFATIGLYVLVKCIDKKAKRGDVQNGYILLIGLAMSAIQYFALYITSLESSLGVFIVSAALMVFQKAVLQVSVPA